MKKGKIILGAAAFLISAGGIFAFRAQNKFSSGVRVYGYTANGSCTVSTCRTLAAGDKPATCHTITSKLITVKTAGFGEMFKAKASNTACATPAPLWTIGSH